MCNIYSDHSFLFFFPGPQWFGLYLVFAPPLAKLLNYKLHTNYKLLKEESRLKRFSLLFILILSSKKKLQIKY